LFWLSFPGLEKKESVRNEILNPSNSSFKKESWQVISLALASLAGFRSRGSFGEKKKKSGDAPMVKILKSIRRGIPLPFIRESSYPRNDRNQSPEHPTHPITGLFPCQANFD